MPADAPVAIDMPTARALLAAVSSATRHGPLLACAVVDASGHTITYQRDPMLPFLTGEIALAKARAATLLGVPTSVSQERAATQPYLYARLAELSAGPMVHVAGGIPIRVGRTVIGGIGVSGATPEEDDRYARQAITTAVQQATL